MANDNYYKLTFSAAFLFALIFSHGIISTEQRLLKDCGDDGDVRHNLLGNTVSGAGKSPGVGNVSAQDDFRPLTPGHSHSPGIPRLSADSTDDFRPTTPGHSPGAGHSNGPTSVGLPN